MESFVLRKSLGYIEKYDKFLYLFCPNTGTKFREPYHPNHVIPHRGLIKSSVYIINQIRDLTNN